MNFRIGYVRRRSGRCLGREAAINKTKDFSESLVYAKNSAHSSATCTFFGSQMPSILKTSSNSLCLSAQQESLFATDLPQYHKRSVFDPAPKLLVLNIERT